MDNRAESAQAAEGPPVATTTLPVGDGHTLHIETFGQGTPVLFLHGGPGSGCHAGQRRLFDPDRFHAVLFDQRGAGHSTPHGSRIANTTRHLVDDIERVRHALGIARWLVVGGSWGATLALAYAQTHPDRVAGMVLRAVFLGTRAELDRAFGTGLATFYPRLYADFLDFLPPPERDAPLDAYFRRILDPLPDMHRPAAFAWYQTERILSQLAPGADRLDLTQIPARNAPFPASPFMEAHYFSHDCFLAPDQLRAGAARLSGIPGVIVQGRYDLLCPPSNAQELSALWPGSEVRVVESAGHSQTAPGVQEAMQQALTDLAG